MGLLLRCIFFIFLSAAVFRRRIFRRNVFFSFLSLGLLLLFCLSCEKRDHHHHHHRPPPSNPVRQRVRCLRRRRFRPHDHLSRSSSSSSFPSRWWSLPVFPSFPC